MDGLNFVHLNVRSGYSFFQSTIKINQLIERTAQLGMSAVALTDIGIMAGIMEFHDKAAASGIKPIIGATIQLLPSIASDALAELRPSLLTLLCENMEGYRNLCLLVSSTSVTRSLLAQHSSGLIALTGGSRGEVTRLCAQGRVELAAQAAGWLRDCFADRVYIELHPADSIFQQEINSRLVQVSSSLGLPCVATAPCCYLNEGERQLLNRHRQMDNLLPLDDTPEGVQEASSFLPPDTIANYFCHTPESINNSRIIADRCNLDLRAATKYHFPRFEPLPGNSYDSMLETLARDGLEKRPTIILNTYPEQPIQQIYAKRLAEELARIKQAGFSVLFLIVADYVGWAKNNDIPVGPGRGAVTGSLVAYSLGITTIDPLRYNLSFEHFMKPDRSDKPPDFCLDFCQERLQEVIQYLTDKYGREQVGRIATYGTITAAGAIRGLGFLADMDSKKVNRIAKMVPWGVRSIDELLKNKRSLKKRFDKEPAIRGMLETAFSLTGLPRSAGTNAAGLVIAPEPLTHHLPVSCNDDGSYTTQYASNCIDAAGLVRLDFLGLKHLTHNYRVEQLVRAQNAPDFSVNNLRNDDPATLELLASGKTEGIFGFESSGMRDFVVRFKPTSFEDLATILSLYRPGPIESGMVDDIIARKNGQPEVSCELPELEPILKNTYGIIIYREQFAEVANVVAGYSFGECETLRSRIPHIKDEDERIREKVRFIDAAERKGVFSTSAANIFDLLTTCAAQSCSRAHAVAYAMIAYQTAYLKAHFPNEFQVVTGSE